MSRTTLTNEELLSAWLRGNDRGEGYPVGGVSDSPAEAAERSGYIDITDIGPDGAVCATNGRGELVVICDANGPWAVTVAS